MGAARTKKTETAADRILDEAERQLLQRGNAKLRVVDIAAALGVSHANIYRTFASREALLDGMVDRWLRDSEVRSQRAVDRATNSSEVLTALILDMHTATRKKLAAGPGVKEIYLWAMHRRGESVARHGAFILGIAQQALEDGCASGEFALDPQDIPHALFVLEGAVGKFINPLVMAESLDEDTPRQARSVMQMLTTALRETPAAFIDAGRRKSRKKTRA